MTITLIPIQAYAGIIAWTGFMESVPTSLYTMSIPQAFDNDEATGNSLIGSSTVKVIKFNSPVNVSLMKVRAENVKITTKNTALATSANHVHNFSAPSTFTYSVNREIDEITVTQYQSNQYGKLFEMEFEGVALGLDTTSPKVISIEPANNSANVPINSYVSVTFDENIMISSINESVIDGVLSDNSAINNRLTIYPKEPLKYDTTYSVKLIGIKDMAGNTMQSMTYNFTTMSDNTPLELLYVKPPSGSAGVPLDTNIEIAFNKSDIDVNSLDKVILEGVEGVTKSVSDGKLFLTLTYPLMENTNYKLTIDGVKDSKGNMMSSAVIINFTTGADTSPLKLLYMKPPMNEIVSLNSYIELLFSKNINPDSLVYTLHDSSGNNVSNTLSVAGAKVKVTPILKSGETYTFTLTSVSDTNDIALNETYSVTFKTIVSTGSAGLDSVLGDIANGFGLFKSNGFKIITAALVLGLIFICAKWLWNKTRQWLKKA